MQKTDELLAAAVGGHRRTRSRCCLLPRKESVLAVEVAGIVAVDDGGIFGLEQLLGQPAALTRRSLWCAF